MAKVTKTKTKKEGDFYWGITYECRDAETEKKDKKFWQERKRTWQKLMKLEKQVWEIRCKLNSAAIERIDGYLKEYERSRNDTGRKTKPNAKHKAGNVSQGNGKKK